MPSKTNPVTALAFCRSTLSPTDCQECVAAAVLGIRLVCSNQTAAQVWYTYCMLRYSATNFINKTDDSNAFILYDTRVVPYSNYPTIDFFCRTCPTLQVEMDSKTFFSNASDDRLYNKRSIYCLNVWVDPY